MALQRRYCSNCGAVLNATDQFCEQCGAPVQSADLTTQIPYTGSDPLLSWEVDYPESLSRWKIFVKIFLAIPHYLILWVLGFAASAVSFIAWFAILVTARFPRGLFDFMVMYMRWTANVQAYVMLQRDEYPPFGEDPYQARLDLAYPESLSRWKIFVKWLLVIPNAFIYSFLVMAMIVVVIIAFFAILITGNMPRSLFDFITGVNRWGYRINAYTYLMTDKYPPFSLSE